MNEHLREGVAVLGFGNQGKAQAARLAAARVSVTVGARAGGASWGRAVAAGHRVVPLAAAAACASVVTVLLPDETLPALWGDFAAALRPAATIVFAHGFNLVYSDLAFPAQADVVLVSPAGPGSVLERPESRLPAYLAVHRDRSGGAWAFAEAYAEALGLRPLVRTTAREETEVDLFGEQVVLCGGLNALVRNAFEVLVGRGFAPEIAYLECVHQVKYLADLLHERGPAGFRRAISGTARYGDLTRGPRVIGAESRRAMEAIANEVMSGAFAREWRAEAAAASPTLGRLVGEAERHPIEVARRRALAGDPQPPQGGPESRNALSKD